jgi:hypothetical protein
VTAFSGPLGTWGADGARVSLATERPVSVLVVPGRIEWDDAAAEHEALVADFQAKGFQAWLQEPKTEFTTGGMVTDHAIDVSIYLWETVGKEVVAALVGMAVERLRRCRSKRKRVIEVHGERGEVLSRVEVPADDD